MTYLMRVETPVFKKKSTFEGTKYEYEPSKELLVPYNLHVPSLCSTTRRTVIANGTIK